MFLPFPKVIFIVQCLDVHSVRLERWKASCIVTAMCFVLRNFSLRPFFFPLPLYFTNSYHVESAHVLVLSSFFVKLQLFHVSENAALVGKRYCSAHLSLGFK